MKASISLSILLAVLLLAAGCNKDDDDKLSIPTNGLMAYFPFSGDATDHGGKEVATEVKGALLTTDRAGNSNSAYQFNGNERIDILNVSFFNAMSAFTVAAWVRPSQTGILQTVISKADPGRDFVIQLTAQDRVNWHYHPDFVGFQTVSSDSLVAQTGSWIHITAVYNGIQSRLYINGVLVAEEIPQGVPGWEGEKMQIGALAGGAKFHGKIDEVVIYNRALSASEIASLASQ
jgi:hypothetical protein